MKALLLALVLVTGVAGAEDGAEMVQTPYEPQKVLFDFYFNEPAHMGPALFWVRSLMNPLVDAPYGFDPFELDIKVLVHGAEVVTLAKANYEKYREVVERMRYYAQLGVEFRVCGLAAHDYGYRLEDFHDFVIVAPSAMTELAHWQLQGYALIQPKIMEKIYSIEEIR